MTIKYNLICSPDDIRKKEFTNVHHVSVGKNGVSVFILKPDASDSYWTYWISFIDCSNVRIYNDGKD